MNNVLIIRKGNGADKKDVLGISRSLSDWFTDNGVKFIEQDLEFQNLIVAEKDSEIIGYLSYFTYEGVGHLGWIGVLEDYHGKGVGKSLLMEFEKELRKRGVDTLQVKTLGESVDYPPYEYTRKFYEKMGFVKLRSEFTDNPECPEELIMRKSINTGQVT